MLKRKNAKKVMDNYKENAVRIMCKFCDIKENCKLRANKEKSESMGIKTYCTLTPNIPKKSKPKRRKTNK